MVIFIIKSNPYGNFLDSGRGSGGDHFLINQNRTKVSDRTVVTHNRTIKTDDGEIRVQRTQVMDSTSTQYHKPGAASVASKTEYDLQAINNYYQQKAGIEAQQKHIQEVKPAIEAQPIRIEQPKAITSIDADENLSHSKAQEGKKQCTRCRISLPYSKFSKSSKHPDGVTIWCTSCLKGKKHQTHEVVPHLQGSPQENQFLSQ